MFKIMPATYKLERYIHSLVAAFDERIEKK